MLSISVVEEIARQLAECTSSQRQIARRLGVSRATVSAIARGKRGLFGRRHKPHPLEPDLLDPPERCPKCGYLVHLPCLVCRTREYRWERRSPAVTANGRLAPARSVRRRSNRRRRLDCRNGMS